ncbi:hypothetical protein TeGR_g7955, partial [Tetraparma gracilis]
LPPPARFARPKISPIVDVFIPLRPSTQLSSKPFLSPGLVGTAFGWLPYSLHPFSPVFHAAWWNAPRGGGADFIDQLDTSAVLDHEELVSPNYSKDRDFANWPWEQFFRKKKGPKAQKERANLSPYTPEIAMYEDLDVSTPKWQRYSKPIHCRFNFEHHDPSGTHPGGLPLNKLGASGFVPFETALFKGRMSFAVADLPASEVAEVFRGKKRRYRYIVIGTFKRRLPYSSVYTGQVISQIKSNRGTEWLMRSMRWMLRSLSPAMKETVDGAGNKVVMSPVAATAQRMAIGSKNDNSSSAAVHAGQECEEDITVLGSRFVGKKGVPLNSESRKKVMCGEEELKKHYYETDVEYTFEFYQHLFDPVTFHMNVVGMTTLDVASVLGNKPVRIVSKLLTEDEYLWDVEMWHERLLEQPP